jgi:hypothetical protein
MLRFVGAAAAALLLAGPAMAQGYTAPFLSGQVPGGYTAPFISGAVPQTSLLPPLWDAAPPQQMPESWTGHQIGNNTFFSGSNGGSMSCRQIGRNVFCN